MFGQASSLAGSAFRPAAIRRRRIVACAAAIPLAVLALAVSADYAKVSHFGVGVQHAADAASVAAAEAVARQPDADRQRRCSPARLPMSFS